MSKEYEILKKSYEAVEKELPYRPDIAVVLGSGLGNFVNDYKVDKEIPYSSIPNLKVSTVAGHAGKYVFMQIGDKKVVAMQGRIHKYEGYTETEVVRSIRLMGMMGAKTLILTNAAGGVNKDFNAGDFMLIKDQISLFVKSPLIGENVDELGVRFPDMSNLYDEDLQDKIRKAAKDLGVDLKEGVYVEDYGPHFETKSDVRLLAMLNCDAVGMSTGIEAIAAHHMGMKVCGVSFISNKAAGISTEKLSHEDVNNAAEKSGKVFVALLDKIIKEL